MTSGSNIPLTGSYIYTSSVNFPSLNDVKWKQYSFNQSGSTSVTLELAVITGSVVKGNFDTYVSSSNYYYYKFINSTGTTVNFTGYTALLATSSSVNLSNSGSGQILQASYTKSVQTDDAEVLIIIS